MYEERGYNREWSENEIERLIGDSLNTFWEKRVEEQFFNVAVKFDELEAENIKLQDEISFIKDELDYSVTSLSDTIKEVSESQEKRIKNKIGTGINSSLTLGQLAILIKELKGLDVFRNTNEKIGEGSNLITNVGAESMRIALGMERPSSDREVKLSDEDYYENLNQVRVTIQKVVDSLIKDMKELENKIPLEKKVKI
ncbi:hypothetical protein [Roseivirga echinicomitans]|uniref:Uncharacterized protein n=1 Tax=Roseivirga echinicomitans TaxID=296218 RepID=A0A150XEN8_9BACT|nr:hypothetical protein [Roseivirga echinicomitans]KYG77173.1 hypothetical protein AWN68_18240 [Roseivirga echinicomitans]